jgi:diamine N-acetyltransferase
MSAAGACTKNLYEVNRAPTLCEFLTQVISNPIMPNIRFRKFRLSDQAEIQAWPPYPPEFAELDYALRSNGWLAEFRDRPDASIYIAEQNLEIVAFSLLAKTSPAEAEFRIAVHPDKIGRDIGRIFTSLTLEEGVSKTHLSRIHLIVRKNNARAISLYKQLGFRECGDCVKTVNRKTVQFLMMEFLNLK